MSTDSRIRYPEQRRQRILGLLVDGTVPVATLAETLEVTTETIRRDLEVLERRNLVRRLHGGAELRAAGPFEQALAARHREQWAEKQLIASRLLAELPPDGVVGLDSGSLTYQFAAMFPRDTSLTVVTNNLPAADLLSRSPGLTVLCLPGTVRGVSSAAVDATTCEVLQGLTVDLAIMGANGLTAARGLSTTTTEEMSVKRALLLSARRRILPVISSRVGRDSFVRFARASELDLIVTDAGADPAELEALAEQGPEVVVAG